MSPRAEHSGRRRFRQQSRDALRGSAMNVHRSRYRRTTAVRSACADACKVGFQPRSGGRAREGLSARC
jgi:hypothetical protein